MRFLMLGSVFDIDVVSCLRDLHLEMAQTGIRISVRGQSQQRRKWLLEIVWSIQIIFSMVI